MAVRWYFLSWFAVLAQYRTGSPALAAADC
jgi:hypothetical protein